MGVVHLLRYWVVIQGDPTSFVWFNEQKSWKWKLIKNSWKYKGFEDFRKLHYNLTEKIKIEQQFAKTKVISKIEIRFHGK